MTETSGENGQSEQKHDWLSRSWWMGLFIIVLATWLVKKNLIAGEGWITVAIFVYTGWQGRGYAERKLNS